MFTWLAALPVLVQICIVVGILIVAVILAYIGKVNIKVGKNVITFGKARATIVSKRSCTDCRNLVMMRSIKYDKEYNLIRSDILRDQLNYADQKISEVSYMLTSSYRDDIIHLRVEGTKVDMVRENKEYLLYQETLSNAMLHVKNELRKAFKENGFVEMDDKELMEYVDGKTKLLINIAREYVRSRYPFENMIVPLDWRLDRLPEAHIETAVLDLFCKAKQIKLLADDKLKQLGEKFDQDMLEFERM